MPTSYNFQQQQMMDAMFAAAVDIALFTQCPQGNASAVELVAAGYSRQSITFTTVVTLCASNTADITWTAGETWQGATFYGICEAASGDLIYWDTLPAPIIAPSGSTVTIKAGSLLIDWVNPSTSMSTDIGVAPTGPADINASVVTIQNQMGPLTDLPGVVAGALVSVTVGSVTYMAVPVNNSSMIKTTVIQEQTLGAFSRMKILDDTKGSTAGYTITGPTSIAF